MDIFIITSVIHTDKTSGWSYCPVRSYYSDEERFRDTLKTIQSIRQYLKGAYIVLLEGSKLTEEEEKKLKESVDCFLDYSNDPFIVEKVNSQKKGQGETWKMMKFLVDNKDTLKQYRRIFKISGRYWLTDTFQPELFSYEKETVKKCSENGVSTVLYSVAVHNLDAFIELQKKIIVYLETDTIGIENLFFGFYKNFHFIDNLGVEGWIAVMKDGLYQF